MNSIFHRFWATVTCLACFQLGCNTSFDDKKAIQEAKVAIEIGEFETAIQNLTIVLEHQPKNAEALELRAECLFKANRTEEEISDFKTLLSLEGIGCEKRREYANRIVNEYDFLLRDDSAIRYQLLVMEIQKDCPRKAFSRKNGFHILSNLYHRSGQYPQALATNDSAIAYGDTSSFINMIRASIFAEMGNLDSAIYYQSKAIERAKMDNRPYFGDYDTRANLYQEKEDLPNACADWQMALELGSTAAQSKLDSFCLNNRHRSR